MLSVQAMQDLGLADEKTTLDRLEKTLSTIEALPKYRGHLYNWYDTRTLDLLGHPYISTVDSGNLVLSLIALKNALAGSSDPKAEELCKRVFVLIDRTDFSFLYNPKRRLLSIGYDPLENKQSENCYDLLLSEARSAYYFAIAKRQIPPECWASRRVTLWPVKRLTCIHARPAPTVTAVPPSSATVTAKSSSVLNTPEVRVEK